MKKIIFCISLAMTGLMTACVEKNEAVDADSKPSWLGGSIYQELKNPKYLTGTFSTYLRLIDDLDESETLNRTSSRTVFPANDEAFERFFKSNDWGVTSYEQLSLAQKKMLLYNSMLENAILVSMLSNASNTSSSESSIAKGVAMKHSTAFEVTDSIQLIKSDSEMPSFNKFWDKFRGQGNLYVVSDNSKPSMVHFTREHMLANGITTLGPTSDFALLTGTEYEEGMAYVFGDQIVVSDVTCQNGYIHQMKDVIVPPGNMAQVLRNGKETSYFSHILDYFCAPYENETLTNSYNSWAMEQRKAGNNVPDIPMIYEVRYLNDQSNSTISHRLFQDNDGLPQLNMLLDFDPGWNAYSPNGESGGVDYKLADVGTMFVPNNKAMVKFFTKGGDGAYLIDLYGAYPNEQNTEEHLLENLDALFTAAPDIITSFINNLMKPSFVNSVPSKFETIQNDAQEYMGITLDKLDKKDDGKYDITVANNGVVYKMTELIAPDQYQCVMAPALVYPDMTIMRSAIKETNLPTGKTLGVDFSYYLQAMQSNFAFFIPDNNAFNNYYIDPASFGQTKERALRFYMDESGKLACQAFDYDPATGQVGAAHSSLVEFDEYKELLKDILNYHTVVLEKGEKVGENHYYKTKHGGEILLTDTVAGRGLVKGGQQIDNNVDPANITTVYSEKNGKAFRVDHVIQAPRNSVSKTLHSHKEFSEFWEFCNLFGDDELLAWAGISKVPNELNTTEQDAYIIFTRNFPGDGDTSYRCAYGGDEEQNVKMFNTYNYTLYAPNNEAMKKAYEKNLPKWDDVTKLYEQYKYEESAAANNAKKEAKEMIDKMRNFARYHFQSTSVYADQSVNPKRYSTLSTDEVGIAYTLKVSGGGNKIYVEDEKGNVHEIDANAPRTNLMTRDYVFKKLKEKNYWELYTSSFCVIHELSEPLDSGDWQYNK